MRLKTIFWGLGGFILLILGWYVYTPAYQPPRDYYPPLSDRERRSMDLKLFNELSVVNQAWPPMKTFEKRQDLIQEMGRQGFEVADLAYALLDVKYGMSGRSRLMPSERSSYYHLRGLANRGDPSAQCLTALVIQRWHLDMSDFERYVLSAAKAGHPYCTNILSGLLRIKTGPKGPLPKHYWQTIPKDNRKGRELKLLAAKLGVQRAQLFLMRTYGAGNWGYPLDLGKAKCWFILAKKGDTGATLSDKTYLSMHINRAIRKGHSADFLEYSPESWCQKITKNRM